MSTIIDNIAQWVAGLTYDDIPVHLIERARLQILNIIAAVVSGRHCDALKSAVPVNLPDGGSTVIPGGRKTAVEYAVFINALHSMSFDFDDYMFMGHTGHSSVLVPLAASEEAGLTLKELLLSQIIANEVEGRLGASVLFGPHNGQMWSYIHTVGAAVAVSKLYGLSREQVASAIALSLYQPNYPLSPGFMLSDSKLLTASIPLLSGIICAKLAKRGMKGNTDLLEAENGFLSRFSYLPLPHLLSGLGEWWVTDTLAFKPYPGCAYIDTAVDGIYDIMDQYRQKTGARITPSDIRRVDVFANILTMGMNALSEMYDDGTLHPVNINFSIPRSLAVAMVNGSLQARHLSSEALSGQRDAINAVAEKVTLHHDWLYTFGTLEASYDALGGRFMLGDTGAYRLIKAFRRIRKDMPRVPLNIQALPKAWLSLPGKTKKIIRSGLRRKDRHVRMDRFVFSFGARIRLETNDGQVYEAESVVPRGASRTGQKDVVLDKLASALDSVQKSRDLFEMTDPQTPVSTFVAHVAR
ncbi:MAG: MmgE/PrpD family protein [Deltaproteobacteria bacterium]|nr:MmgE/PrpD family protein [Deltaproteobacteria bacterium]